MIIKAIEAALLGWARQVPLEIFTVVGAFTEEVIAPIPSPLIMATAGSAAFAQGRGFAYLFWLSLVGSAGKTAGAWVVYFISEKLGSVAVDKFGRFLGVTHEDIEAVRKRFRGGWRDAAIVFALRAIPIMPTSVVSMGCGVIRSAFWPFLWGSFLGNGVRNFIFLYLGFAGVSAYGAAFHHLENAESLFQLAFLAGAVALVAWIYYRRHKTSRKK